MPCLFVETRSYHHRLVQILVLRQFCPFARSRIKLLQDARLVGENAHTEVSMVDAALCFAWSRPLWPDETRLREMSQKLTFVDFYEALARLADVFSPVPRVSAYVE